MGLIDLKTDLTSLRYGSDIKGGGESRNAQFMNNIYSPETTGVDQSFTDPSQNPQSSEDFVLRGGVLYPNRVENDFQRIGNFMASGKGVNFIAKQNLLERQQAKVPRGQQPTRIYSPANTLLEIAGGSNSTGLHVDGKGLNPFINDVNTYLEQQKNEFNDIDTNRLGLLWTGKIQDTPLFSSHYLLPAKNWGIDTFSKFNILNFSGGPNSSIPGVTNSVYKRVTDTTYKSQLAAQNKDILNSTFSTFDYDLLNEASTIYRNYGEARPLSNFIRFITDGDLSERVYSNIAARNLVATDYERTNREITYGLGNPGKIGLDRVDPYGEGITEGESTPTVDEITFSPILESKEESDALINKDFIPFYITVINNDPEGANKYLHFRAFIDQYSDNFSSEWQSHRFLGRGENFYTYGGFSREINLAFKVHAQSKQELIPMYDKLNYLASVTAPDYGSSQKGLMKGNLIKLTIGDWVKDIPGILTSIAYSVPNTYPWDLGMNSTGDERNGKTLPTLIDVSTFNFTPISSTIPQLGSKFINNG